MEATKFRAALAALVVAILVCVEVSAQESTCSTINGDCEYEGTGGSYTCENTNGNCNCGEAEVCVCRNSNGDCNCGTFRCTCENSNGHCNCGRCSFICIKVFLGVILLIYCIGRCCNVEDVENRQGNNGGVLQQRNHQGKNDTNMNEVVGSPVGIPVGVPVGRPVVQDHNIAAIDSDDNPD
eukprot:jgi/Bigna1/67584/fgenesh1_pg.4_\